MNKVLIYLGTSNENKQIIEDIFNQIGVKISFIGDNDLDNTLKELLETSREEYKIGNRNPFMYIDGNDKNEIKNLESILRNNNVNIERQALKTKTNIGWTLRELMDEIDEEFEYFKLRDHLYHLIMNPDKEKIARDPDYLKLMSMAFSLLEDESVEKNIIEIAIKTIENYKK